MSTITLTRHLCLPCAGGRLTETPAGLRLDGKPARIVHTVALHVCPRCGNFTTDLVEYRQQYRFVPPACLPEEARA